LTKQEVITKRRLEISKCLQKSIVTPSGIHHQTNIPLKTINNDLQHMRKASIKWLHKHTLDGYVHATQQTIEQIQDIETEMQEMRNILQKDHPDRFMQRKSILMGLAEIINLRWVIQGDGPTYLSNKYTNENATR